MANYITDVAVSMTSGREQDLSRWGYTKIYADLNKGAGGRDIFLWFRKDGSAPITRLQLTYNNAMAGGLSDTGFTRINTDLNAGAGGSDVFLWYFRGSGEFDTPIEEIHVTTSGDEEAQKFGNDWERLGCDLNRKAKGRFIYIWVKRAQQTYICDLTANSTYNSDEYYLRHGFIRVDEDTNRGAGGRDIFIWYRQTTDPKRALTDLQVSTYYSQYQQYNNQGYSREGVNLNKGTDSDNEVFMWSKKQGSKPIKGIVVLLQSEAVSAYQEAGIAVIQKDLNAGNKGQLEYICVNQ